MLPTDTFDGAGHVGDCQKNMSLRNGDVVTNMKGHHRLPFIPFPDLHPRIKFSADCAACHITLNRPAKLNALNLSMCPGFFLGIAWHSVVEYGPRI